MRLQKPQYETMSLKTTTTAVYQCYRSVLDRKNGPSRAIWRSFPTTQCISIPVMTMDHTHTVRSTFSSTRPQTSMTAEMTERSDLQYIHPSLVSPFNVNPVASGVVRNWWREGWATGFVSRVGLVEVRGWIGRQCLHFWRTPMARWNWVVSSIGSHHYPEAAVWQP